MSRLGAWWLFSPRADLAAFLGSAGLAMLALLIGWRQGWLEGETPEWAWITGVLMVDVAHVWSTAFLVYFEPRELARRPLLYLGTPVLALGLGLLLHAQGPWLFWRALAYLAVYHFVRQQYGWVALYGRRIPEPSAWGRRLDAAAVYAATLYPLVWWHAHLPRRFWWFLPEDFAPLPGWVAEAAWPVYLGIMGAWALRAGAAWLGWGRPNPGRDLVILTTAACWYLGIVRWDSDYAFTVTNVFIHGIPYMVAVYWRRRAGRPEGSARTGPGLLPFLATLWALAYLEELLWDRALWHERGWLFGAPWELDLAVGLFTAGLAVPQITHYLLDGFLWRGRAGPAGGDPPGAGPEGPP